MKVRYYDCIDIYGDATGVNIEVKDSSDVYDTIHFTLDKKEAESLREMIESAIKNATFKH